MTDHLLVKSPWLWVFLLLNSTIQAQAQSPQKKALFVIVDGIPRDVIEKVATPNLDSIAAVGGYAPAYTGGQKGTYSETPTISAVGYNSLLTGTWVNKHNVWGNDIAAPNYAYWSIFRFLKDQYPHKRTAVFSTWLDNRTKLIGEGLPQTNHLRVTHSFDGFELDTLRFPHDGEKLYIQAIDELVVDEAADYLRKQAPDLSWVYLEFTDDMGHRYGDSEKFYQAVRQMDGQMGRLWRAIRFREKNFNEDWLVVITTDHGRDAQTGKGHGGQSDRERATWIVTNAQDRNAQFQATPGIVDIMPTLARHLAIALPKAQAFELDGVPFTGPLSLIRPAVNLQGQKLSLSWQAINPAEKVKVWVTTSNHFQEGGQDNYRLLGELEAKAEKAEFDLGRLPSPFYKVVLEGEHNNLNSWIVNAKGAAAKQP